MADVQLRAVLDLQDKMTGKLKSSGGQVSAFQSTLGKMKTVAIGAGIAMAGLGTAAVTMAIKSAGEIEKTKIALETLLGSTEEAGKLLSELTEFAAKTPFDLPGVQVAAKQLLAVGAATREDVIPTLKAVGDVAAGTGSDLARIILNFGQVATQGKLTGRELRDFAVNGIPLIKELADQFGTTEQAISEMVERGQIGFNDVRNSFIRMSSEGGRFADLMDKQSTTLPGIIENIKDKFGILARQIIGIDEQGVIKEGGLFDKFKGIALGVLSVLESVTDETSVLGGFMKTLGDVIRDNIAPAWRTAYAAIQPHLPLLKQLAGVIGGTIGTALLGALILVSNALAGLVTMIGTWIGWIKQAWDWINNLKHSVSLFVGDIRNAIQAVNDFFNTIEQKTTKKVSNFWSDIKGGAKEVGNILGFAGGGFVSAGRPIMVGERGAEMFVPNQNGRILRNDQLGSSGGTTVNFTVNGNVNDNNVNQIINAVKEALKRDSINERIGV